MRIIGRQSIAFSRPVDHPIKVRRVDSIKKTNGSVADNVGVIDFCPMLDAECDCQCFSSVPN